MASPLRVAEKKGHLMNKNMSDLLKVLEEQETLQEYPKELTKGVLLNILNALIGQDQANLDMIKGNIEVQSMVLDIIKIHKHCSECGMMYTSVLNCKCQEVSK